MKFPVVQDTDGNRVGFFYTREYAEVWVKLHGSDKYVIVDDDTQETP